MNLGIFTVGLPELVRDELHHWAAIINTGWVELWSAFTGEHNADGTHQPGVIVPAAHGPSHLVGAPDALAVTGLAGYPGGTTTFLRADGSFAAPPINGGTPAAHKATHETGGGDVVDVTKLGGYPGGAATFLRADGAFAAPPINGGTPAAHAATHDTGGSDPITALSAAVLTSGALADARLSSNVPLKTTPNDFTALNSFLGAALVRTSLDVRATANPMILVRDEAAAVDSKVWQAVCFGGAYYFRAINDAQTVIQKDALVLSRTGAVAIGGPVSERGRAAPMGEWTTYAPGMVGAGWSVDVADVQSCRYMLIGKTLFVTANVINSSVTAGGTVLFVYLPAGMTVATEMRMLMQWSEGGATQGSVGYCYAIAGDNFFYLAKVGYAPWNVTVNATEVHFSVHVEIQ